MRDNPTSWWDSVMTVTMMKLKMKDWSFSKSPGHKLQDSSNGLLFGKRTHSTCSIYFHLGAEGRGKWSCCGRWHLLDLFIRETYKDIIKRQLWGHINQGIGPEHYHTPARHIPYHSVWAAHKFYMESVCMSCHTQPFLISYHRGKPPRKRDTPQVLKQSCPHETELPMMYWRQRVAGELPNILQQTCLIFQVSYRREWCFVFTSDSGSKFFRLST